MPWRMCTERLLSTTLGCTSTSSGILLGRGFIVSGPWTTNHASRRAIQLTPCRRPLRDVADRAVCGRGRGVRHGVHAPRLLTRTWRVGPHGTVLGVPQRQLSSS